MRRISTTIVLAAAVLGLLPPIRSAAQGTLSTILSNGPTANRINLVVLSEGYTAGELGQFLVDATNAVGDLLSQLPYSEYRSYFNAFAISVASAQSGSDHPRLLSYADTYFNSSFESYGISQLLTIPPNNFDGQSANGQGRVDALLAALMPEYDLVLMVVNDTLYGGSGGPALISSLHRDAPELVRHESGHTLGGLTDEYGDPYPIAPVERPNATAQTNRGSVKWAEWIAPTTPLPTPDVAGNSNLIGLFEGAQYQAKGWYRPKHDCKMRSIRTGATTPFCEVCSEQLVKSIYGLVRPVDTFSPSVTNVAVSNTLAVTFSLSVLKPATHSLAIQWQTNGVAVTGATNESFELSPLLLGGGTHILKALVTDPTPLVRTDPANALKAEIAWTLAVTLNQMSLVSAEYLPGDRFRFLVRGAGPQPVVIEYSSDLVNWAPLATNTLLNGEFDYTNLNLSEFPQRFYRTLSRP